MLWIIWRTRNWEQIVQSLKCSCQGATQVAQAMLALWWALQACSPLLSEGRTGKVCHCFSLDCSCWLLECGDRRLINIQVVIQPQVWKWEEGTHTDPEAGKYPWIPQKRHESESGISRLSNPDRFWKSSVLQEPTFPPVPSSETCSTEQLGMLCRAC